MCILQNLIENNLIPINLILFYKNNSKYKNKFSQKERNKKNPNYLIPISYI